MYITLPAEISDRLQRQGLEIVGKSGMIVASDSFIPYVSGKIGNYKIQSDALQEPRNQALHAQAVDLMTEMYCVVEAQGTSPTTRITGGETKDWIFSLPVAERVQVPHTCLYKNGQMVGSLLRHATVTHIADINNNGSSMRDTWLPMIQREKGVLEHALFFVERGEGGVHVLNTLHLDYHAAVHLHNSAWDALHHGRFIDTETYRGICEYRLDKESWAKKMLRSDAGIQRLQELFSSQNPAVRLRAQKILDSGYPDLKEELTERLKPHK